MDLNTDALQSIAAGASGGLPMMVLLVNTMRGLKDSFNNLSERLLKLEVLFEATYKEEVRRLADRVDSLEKDIQKFRGEK